MTFKTPVAIAAAVATALGGVAAAAVAFPSPSSSPVTTVAARSADPEARTETIHVARHHRRHGHDDRVAATADASRHHDRGATADDSGHRGRGRGRGGHHD